MRDDPWYDDDDDDDDDDNDDDDDDDDHDDYENIQKHSLKLFGEKHSLKLFSGFNVAYMKYWDISVFIYRKNWHLRW